MNEIAAQSDRLRAAFQQQQQSMKNQKKRCGATHHLMMGIQ
jgi:hypothetical protein